MATLKRKKVSAPPLVSVSAYPGGPVRIAPLYAVLKQIERYSDKMLRAQAQHLLMQVVEQETTDPATVISRLDFHLRGSELPEALDIMESAVQAYPDNAAVIRACARVLEQAELPERAAELLEYSIPRCNDSVLLLKSLGQIYKSQGKRDLAKDACERAFAAGGEADPFIFFLLCEVSTNEDFKQHLPTVNKLLEIPDLSNRERGVLHFSLAYYYRSLDTEHYFENLHRANALLAEDHALFIDRMNRLLANVKKNFTNEMIANTSRERSNGSYNPIFIAGLPRSGTTLLEQILASHSSLVAAGETGAIRYARARAELDVGANPDPNPLFSAEGAAPDFLRGIVEHFCNHSLISRLLPGRLIEKSTDNWEQLGLILLAFPRAKILHLRRDPMDTILSSYHQCFSGGFDHRFHLEALARYTLYFDEFMQFWTELFPNRIFQIDYEQLVTEPERHIEEILSFLDLEFEPGMLLFHERVDRVRTASTLQVRRAINADSIGKWRQYRDHLEPATSIVLSQLVDTQDA